MCLAYGLNLHVRAPSLTLTTWFPKKHRLGGILWRDAIVSQQSQEHDYFLGQIWGDVNFAYFHRNTRLSSHAKRNAQMDHNVKPCNLDEPSSLRPKNVTTHTKGIYYLSSNRHLEMLHLGQSGPFKLFVKHCGPSGVTCYLRALYHNFVIALNMITFHTTFTKIHLKKKNFLDGGQKLSSNLQLFLKILPV